jgi:dUTP pyrophosphatase
MSAMQTVRIMRLPHADDFAGDVPLPSYDDSRYAGGLDLRAAIPPVAGPAIVIEPGRWAAIPTGLVVMLPPGLMGLISPITGLAARHGITVLDAPSMIDAGYRGEVQILLANFGPARVEVVRGMRVAHLVLFPTVRASILEVASVDA